MGVTVTQYQGPTLRFESVSEYADWLLDPKVTDDPDHAVGLSEKWDSPEEDAAAQAFLDKRAEELGL
jgi:hypothetical protein